VLGVLVAVTGVARADDLHGVVLVWQDASFYGEASDTAPAIKLSAPLVRDTTLGRVVPMSVLGVHGDWVEVEPTTSTYCTDARLVPPDDLAKLRLFVKRADLAPVLTAPVAVAGPDGSKLALKPGVPVAPGHFAYQGLSVAAEIPPGSIGLSYVAPKAARGDLAIRQLALKAGAKVKLAGQTLTIAAITPSAHVEHRGTDVLVTLEDGCTSLVVVAPSTAITDFDDEAPTGDPAGPGSGGTGVITLRGNDYLPIATALWAGSHQVAYAAKPLYLPGAPTGKQVCVDRRLRIESATQAPDSTDLDDKLRVCAPAGKVVHEKMRSSSSAAGTTSR
jgi:hypothetical protein